MKYLFSLSFFCLIFFKISAQQVNLVTLLNDSIQETSGLTFINQKLVTHNDSGGNPELYEIDSVSGNITRKVVIANATNVDWEDICLDSTYIYIGDFGNNSGSRTNLKVYRVLISDYINTSNDTVFADTILFNYADQTDFTPTSYSTIFDAEAIISKGDSLYIFTKNWSNFWTNIYALPKTLGTHQISRIDSINVGGLVSGADYNAQYNALILSAYDLYEPFIIRVNQFSGNNFSGGAIYKDTLSVPESYQIEGVTFVNENEYLLSAEKRSPTVNAALYRLTFHPLGIETYNDAKIKLYPNPTSKNLIIDVEKFELAKIYTINGILIKESSSQTIDVSELSKGIYFVKIKAKNLKNFKMHKLIIN